MRAFQTKMQIKIKKISKNRTSVSALSLLSFSGLSYDYDKDSFFKRCHIV